MRPREPQYERIDPSHQREYEDPSEFDRIAFAMRTLRRLRSRQVKVVVYSTLSALKVESGPDHRRGDDARWAIVGIPPRASRAQIVYALASLLGVAQVPYAVQVLLAADGARGA